MEGRICHSTLFFRLQKEIEGRVRKNKCACEMREIISKQSLKLTGTRAEFSDGLE